MFGQYLLVQWNKQFNLNEKYMYERFFCYFMDLLDIYWNIHVYSASNEVLLNDIQK